jgi:hypothetical protein
MDDLQQLLVAQSGQGSAQSDPLQSLLLQQAQSPNIPNAPTPTGPTTSQKVQSSFLGRIYKGMKDPIDAGAQLLTHILPQPVVDAGNAANNWLAENTGLVTKLPEGGVDQALAQDEKQYQESRQATAPPSLSGLVTGKNDPGFDAARLVGNVLSPANLAIAARAPITAATVGGMAKQGALMGAIGGSLTPDTSGGSDGYWGDKAIQAGGGAVGGAVLTPIIGKVVSAVLPKVSAFLSSPEVTGARASAMTDQSISDALSSMNLSVENLPNGTMEQIRQQVIASLKAGKQVDPAALLRQADFKALDIPATQGQITRDATQFAKERNLRAVPNAGEPLLNLFERQNQSLANAVANFGGKNAVEGQQAGSALVGSLAKTDESLRQGVSAAYKAGSESTGKVAELPLQGLAQDYAKTVEDFADKVPSGIKNRFESYGLSGGTQTKLYTVDEADKLLKLINSHVGNDPATNTALGQLRTAVKASITDAPAEDVFQPGRTLAAQRFKLQEAIPALEASANGSASADKFVSRYIINGETGDVQRLADLLKTTDPTAFQQARSQIGAQLQRAAFGENAAGDKVFSPERYAKALRDLGTDKLKAFYTPAEIEKINATARVGAYINSTPAAAPVLGNPNMFWAGHAIDMIPGGSKVMGVAKQLGAALDRSSTVNAAINPTVKPTPYLSPKSTTALARILSGVGVGGGMLAAPIR